MSQILQMQNQLMQGFLISENRLKTKREELNQEVETQVSAAQEQLVKKQRLKSIRLDTYRRNPKAIGFYIRLGYTELGAINLKPNKNEYYCFEKIIR